MARFSLYSLEPAEEWTWPTEGWTPEGIDGWRKRECDITCRNRADVLLIEHSLETGDPWPMTLCLAHFLYVMTNVYNLDKKRDNAQASESETRQAHVQDVQAL